MFKARQPALAPKLLATTLPSSPVESEATMNHCLEFLGQLKIQVVCENTA